MSCSGFALFSVYSDRVQSRLIGDFTTASFLYFCTFFTRLDSNQNVIKQKRISQAATSVRVTPVFLIFHSMKTLQRRV